MCENTMNSNNSLKGLNLAFNCGVKAIDERLAFMAPTAKLKGVGSNLGESQIFFLH